MPYKVNRPLVEEYVQPEADERKNGHIIDVFKQKRRVGWSMSGLTSECVYLEKFSQVPMVTNSTKYSTLLDQAKFLINYSLHFRFYLVHEKMIISLDRGIYTIAVTLSSREESSSNTGERAVVLMDLTVP